MPGKASHVYKCSFSENQPFLSSPDAHQTCFKELCGNLCQTYKQFEWPVSHVQMNWIMAWTAKTNDKMYFKGEMF